MTTILYRTLEASSGACALAVFKLCDAHFVPHTESETPSGADAPDLPERKSVEASSGERVPALFSNCCATILYRTLEAPSCSHAPALFSKLCTAHWKHPVVHMHLICLEKSVKSSFYRTLISQGSFGQGTPRSLWGLKVFDMFLQLLFWLKLF